MNKLTSIYLCLLSLLGFVSCNEDALNSEQGEERVLKGIRAHIDSGSSTRVMPSPLVDSIGKCTFSATDEIIFTKIERTIRPIRPTFSYEDVHYSCQVSGTSISWSLNRTDDIYWSDGLSPHTFIGYNLPHADGQTAVESGFDWNGYDNSGLKVFYGSIGDPTSSGVIDYSCDPADDISTPYKDQEKLCKEDLLLSYTTEQQNGDDAMADIIFHHGLASVRVVVTLTGFSTTVDDPDSKTKVTEMVLHSQPTMYKWDQTDCKAMPLTESDQTAINSFSWSGATPQWNQLKEMKLWQPRKYHGSGINRTFPFYGIVAPGYQNEVSMTFKVSYPNPLDPLQDPVNNLEKEYTATLRLNDGNRVEFRPGYCTNINVNLNHKDEKMTVGAEYMEWQYIDQPDKGSLRMNSTYLSYTDRSKITIADDENATVDDATWLYKGTSGSVYDIYGNDGSSTKPYRISTADQLLSFAYEVKNGRDFVHQFIKLDADITMQENTSATGLSWIGIGAEGKPFNGFFLGSGRRISRLYGEHFFHTIGDNAVIDKLNFGSVLEVQGCGVIAHKNLGLICGCYIDGDVKETLESALYTGSIVGENHSFIIACAHVGKVSGYNTVGGLVGYNNGTVMACYHAGEIVGLGDNIDVHATVGKRGVNSIMFSCYYDESLISHDPSLMPGKSGFPLSTTMMQSSAFVNSDKVYTYNGSSYSGQGKTLRQFILEDILKEEDSGQTAEELAAAVYGDGDVMSENVWTVFDQHFSLDVALQVFRHWLTAIHSQGKEEVVTNCHTFTKAQIEFLYQHYSSEHQYLYTPATYPKVQ